MPSTTPTGVPIKPATPTGTPTITVTPTITESVVITGTPSAPSVSPGPITPPAMPVVSARDSIFDPKSFDMNVVNLEYAIRQSIGSTDKNLLRAAIYTRLMEIARTPNRTPYEQAVMDWLAQQVKKTRVEAARLALAECDSWYSNPWGYKPPQGYDFPDYVIPAPGSPVWLLSTPNPPVLANTSWQSFFAGIVSNNGWSPLNNPLFTKGQSSSSLENVVGFPVFGTVLAYQKLYGTEEGVRTFAETMANLSSKSFNLPPIGVIASPANVSAARMLSLSIMAPNTQKLLGVLLNELELRAQGTTRLVDFTSTELRAAVESIVTGDVFFSFVASFYLSIAIQAIISESFMLDTKIKLRGQLVTNFEKQQAAPLPDLKNLLYYDIRGEVVLYTADYQPTDPVELERLMGGQEVYRAFLLSTLE